MSRWMLLDSEDVIKERAKALKKEHRGHYYSNYQALNSGIGEELGYTELFYREEGDNFYLLKRHDGFYRLLYCAGAVERLSAALFPESVQNGVTVCDIVELEGKEKQSAVVDRLKEEGFRAYRVYHLWECTGIPSALPSIKRYQMFDDRDPEHLGEIYTIFDPYSDLLPMKRRFPSYLESRRTFSCFMGGEYLGSQIYYLDEGVATGEYIYTVKQGIGAGGALLIELLRRCFDVHQVKKLYAWIADDNQGSIALHKSAGFIRTEQYKTTLLRGGDGLMPVRK